MHPEKGLKAICRLFGHTRQAFYDNANRKQNTDMREAIIVQIVTELRELMPRLGTRKLLHELQARLSEHQIQIGRDGLFSLLAQEGMLLRRRQRKVRTTYSDHPYGRYPNLVANLTLSASEQVWVADITYLRVGEGFCYLSLVTDAYSRKIVGFHLSDNLRTEGTLSALEMAFSTRQRRDQRLIHHSDRGFQYCCHAYVERLEQKGAFISMTERSDPRENAIAERVNGILKHEFRIKKYFANQQQALEAVVAGIDIYNQARPHLSLGYLKPDEAHLKTGSLQRAWKNYYTTRRGKEVEMTPE